MIDRLKDDLKKIGVSKRVIDNPSFAYMFREVLYYYAEAQNNSIINIEVKSNKIIISLNRIDFNNSQIVINHILGIPRISFHGMCTPIFEDNSYNTDDKGEGFIYFYYSFEFEQEKLFGKFHLKDNSIIRLSKFYNSVNTKDADYYYEKSSVDKNGVELYYIREDGHRFKDNSLSVSSTIAISRMRNDASKAFIQVLDGDKIINNAVADTNDMLLCDSNYERFESQYHNTEFSNKKKYKSTLNYLHWKLRDFHDDQIIVDKKIK